VSNSHVNKKGGNTDGSRSGTDEDDFLILEGWNSWYAGSGVDGRCGNGGSTFDIIVEAVAPPAEVVEESEGGFHLEVFELDKASWSENIFDGIDEFFNNWKFFFVWKTGVFPAVVEWIFDDFFAVCTDIELNWKGVLWWDSTDKGVKDKLTDWDTKTRGTEISKTKNTATIGNDNAADVLAWVVAEDFSHSSFVFWGDVDTTVGLTVGGPFGASFTDSWGVKNWHGLDWWVGEEEAPEGTLILFTFVGEENVLEHWGWHDFELASDTSSLFVNCSNFPWEKTTKVETVTFFTIESCTFVKL